MWLVSTAASTSRGTSDMMCSTSLFDRTAQRTFVVPVLDQFVAQHVLDHHPGADLLRIGKQLPDRAHQLRDPRVALPRAQDTSSGGNSTIHGDRILQKRSTRRCSSTLRCRTASSVCERSISRPKGMCTDQISIPARLRSRFQLTAARLDLPIVGHLLVQEQRRRADLDGVDASPLRLGEGFRRSSSSPGRKSRTRNSTFSRGGCPANTGLCIDCKQQQSGSVKFHNCEDHKKSRADAKTAPLPVGGRPDAATDKGALRPQRYKKGAHR